MIWEAGMTALSERTIDRTDPSQSNVEKGRNSSREMA